LDIHELIGFWGFKFSGFSPHVLSEVLKEICGVPISGLEQGRNRSAI